jgi:hypothetical protein
MGWACSLASKNLGAIRVEDLKVPDQALDQELDARGDSHKANESELSSSPRCSQQLAGLRFSAWDQTGDDATLKKKPARFKLKV